MKILTMKNLLVEIISKCCKVVGIGQTGDINAPLIPGQSDIDLFVLCTEIPSEKERLEMYSEISSLYTKCTTNVCNGGLWGYGDILMCDDIEVMPMYFTVDEMRQYVNETLHGKHIGNTGRFYPTGRLASIETITILYERDSIWTSLVSQVKNPPPDLFEKLYKYHVSRILDEEDLGRVLLRREILFYHQVLEHALDHLLQALYAVNKTFFPSRKRCEQYLSRFEKQPENCYGRLVQMIQDSGSQQSMEKSVLELRKLTWELMNLYPFYEKTRENPS